MLFVAQRVTALALPHVSPAALTIFASSAPDGSAWDPATALTVYGPLGIICVMLGIGLLVPKYAYAAAIAERDRARALLDQMTPVVAKNSEVTAEAIALIHRMQDRLSSEWDRRSRTDGSAFDRRHIPDE